MKKLLCLIVFLLLATAVSGQLSQKYLVGNQTFGQRYRGVDSADLLVWLDQSDVKSYGDAGNWYDLSGNGNHGTQGTGARQPDLGGRTLLAGSGREFDDANLDWIDLGNLGITKYPFTFTAWWRSNGEAEYIALSISDKSDPSQYYELGRDSIGNRWRFAGRNGGVWPMLFSGVTTPTDWVHVAGVAVDSGDFEFFADGVSVDTDATALAFPSGFDQASIGVLYRSNAPTTALLNGNISSIMIFTRALTAAEIQRLYLVDKPRYAGL